LLAGFFFSVNSFSIFRSERCCCEAVLKKSPLERGNAQVSERSWSKQARGVFRKVHQPWQTPKPQSTPCNTPLIPALYALESVPSREGIYKKNCKKSHVHRSYD